LGYPIFINLPTRLLPTYPKIGYHMWMTPISEFVNEYFRIFDTTVNDNTQSTEAVFI